MEEAYPQWTEDLRISLVRGAVLSYLESEPSAWSMEPVEVLAQVGLTILSPHVDPEYDEFIRDMASAPTEFCIVNARNVFEEIALMTRRSA